MTASLCVSLLNGDTSKVQLRKTPGNALFVFMADELEGFQELLAGCFGVAAIELDISSSVEDLGHEGVVFQVTGDAVYSHKRIQRLITPT